MLNDLFRTYKKIIILVLILLSGVVFWFYGCHRQKGGGEAAQTWEETRLSESGGKGYHFQTSSLEGNVIFGTRGYMAKHKIVPVLMEISCREDSFTGTLRITLPGIDGKGVSHQSAVSCKKGSKSKVVMEVPGLGDVSWFSFELLDSFGAVRFSEEVICKEKTAKEPSQIRDVYLGVLSSQYAALKYIDEQIMEIDSEEVCVHLVRFLEKDFPVDIRELDCLSAMMIDGFETSSLSKMQRECLFQWVEEKGGTLLLGTGERADMVLSGLKRLLGIRIKKMAEQQYDFSSELSYAGNVRLDSAGLSLSPKWQELSLSSPCSAYEREQGEGKVLLLPYSLGDRTFLQWTGRDQVVQLLMQKCIAEDLSQNRQGDTSLWYIKKALYAFMNARHPNTFYYALFFICYLCALGFFSYYLLRKLKKREYIWEVVPLLALVFTALLLFYSGGRTKTSQQEFSALRVYDASEKKDEYYFLYQNNEGAAESVDLISEIQRVEPLDYSYEVDGVDHSSLQNISRDYTINNARNGFDIVFEETAPGNSYILKCSAGAKKEEEANCFSLNVEAEDTSFGGTVTNVSRWNFNKVVLIRGRQYYVMDEVKPGEEKNIDAQKVSFWTGYKEETAFLGNREEASAIGNMVEYLQQEYILENQQQNTIIAVGITNENKFRLFSGKGELGNHLTLYINRYELPEVEGERCVVNINDSCLDEESRNQALEYDVLEKNETKVTYRFDANKVVWKMFRNRDGFEGTIYAYNYLTGKMDEIFKNEDDVMNCGQLEPYVSDMNRMIFTFCLSKGSDYGGAPVLSVVLKEFES